MKILSILSVVALGASLTSVSAQTIAQWGFEVNTPADATDTNVYAGVLPDIGSGTALGLHASSASDWTTPVGNGSANSFSVNTWAVGDFFQFRLGTVGSSGIGVSFDQTSSSTGPRDFDLRYSLDGTTFTAVASYVVLQNGLAPNANWSSGTYQSAYTYNFDLSSITALDNATDVYFRLVNTSAFTPSGGTVGTGGANRVDNFTVYVVPEPTALTLGAIGFGLLVVGQRWFRRN